jgi:hypothetical protein
MPPPPFVVLRLRLSPPASAPTPPRRPRLTPFGPSGRPDRLDNRPMSSLRTRPDTKGETGAERGLSGLRSVRPAARCGGPRCRSDHSLRTDRRSTRPDLRSIHERSELVPRRHVFTARTPTLPYRPTAMCGCRSRPCCWPASRPAEAPGCPVGTHWPSPCSFPTRSGTSRRSGSRRLR